MFMLAMPLWTGQRGDESQTFEETELTFLALLLRKASLRFGQEINEEDRGKFFLAAGNYFQASWAELETLGSAGLPLDEIPVLLHASRHAGVDSGEVLTRRQRGESWLEIFSSYCVPPGSYYVPLISGIRTSPTRPYHYHRKSAREAWKRQQLFDVDFVNLVNVKFLAQHYRLEPDQIVALRNAGWPFIRIHCAVSREEHST